jgi:hypothetical protein
MQVKFLRIQQPSNRRGELVEVQLIRMKTPGEIP